MRFIAILIAACTLSACATTVDRLAGVGKIPPVSAVSNPQVNPDYQPISWPLPDPEPQIARTSNSLWQPGSRAFFRDQRAARVGDILRVNVAIADEAKFENTTDRQRNVRESLAAPRVAGFENAIGILGPLAPDGADPASLLDITGGSQTNGDAEIEREETVTTQIAALITQVLPNGNLVIEGTQEVLVNHEIREVSVKGVIRPQDINSDNTIESNQIAQARITYTGRGQLSDVQQPRWGQQVIDILAPF